MAMASGSEVDDYNDDCISQPRGFLTPPPTWKMNRHSPVLPRSEKLPRRAAQWKGDLFHVIHKVPSGDSPYVRAKHVQLIDKDPSRAISLFWAAINSGDRVDSALKDMAVVMKQLDRSDEAIEAIKSFRHLCPSESQESLDNILVELYKQSARIEEEIEILRLKLKQVEEGIAFGGKRIKKARSQGKKIHITVEKEYSRLLGNLAWAYMQKKDFKSAEEHYRKALSFESDKNKQCNLAVCLMHMNKLAEAKFLLQAIKDSSDNAYMDESHHAKSYERASQMLAELESQRVLKPIKQTECKNETGLARGVADGLLNKMKPLPLPLSVKKMNNEGFNEIPYEKRADCDWRTSRHCKLNMSQEKAYSVCKGAYESPFCNRNIPKIPFTQPLRFPSSRDQRMGWLMENAHGNSCRRLSFESSTGSDNVQSLANQNMNYYSTAAEECDLPADSKFSADYGKAKETSDDGSSDQGYDLIGAVRIWPSDDKNMNLERVWKETHDISTREHKKSWADIVEEDDFLQNYSGHEESLYCFQTEGQLSVGLMDQEGFNDENLDSNIISETPKLFNQAENLSQKLELIDVGSGYISQPEKTTFSMKPVRRSLCFDQNHESSPLTMEYLNFDGQGIVLPEEDLSPPKSISRRNRLPVFKDITACSLKT